MTRDMGNGLRQEVCHSIALSASAKGSHPLPLAPRYTDIECEVQQQYILDERWIIIKIRRPALNQSILFRRLLFTAAHMLRIWLLRALSSALARRCVQGGVTEWCERSAAAGVARWRVLLCYALFTGGAYALHLHVARANAACSGPRDTRALEYTQCSAQSAACYGMHSTKTPNKSWRRQARTMQPSNSARAHIRACSTSECKRGQRDVSYRLS